MAFSCIECKAEIPRDSKACPHCGEVVTEFLRKYLENPIDGKYRITGRLGRGGMGEVYKAVHVHLDAVRVLKLMRASLNDQKSAHQRFIKEAKLATRIHHPNVSTLHDFSTLPDGGYYMVWEFIDGINLTQYLQARGPLSPRHTARLAIEALYGLEAIHRAGIVHRDVSPDNLMIVTDSAGEEQLKIIDLGIAKQGDERATDQTRAGVFMGKLKYCSPEHIGTLEPGERIDGRADVYSIGLVMYEMLTGKPAIVASSPHQYVIAHSTQNPKPLREVNPVMPASPELEALLFKALQKERDDRFSSAKEFADALESILPLLADEPQSVGNEEPSVSAELPAASAPVEAPALTRGPANPASSPSQALAVVGLVLVLIALAGLAFGGYIVWRYSRLARAVEVPRIGEAPVVSPVAPDGSTASSAEPQSGSNMEPAATELPTPPTEASPAPSPASPAAASSPRSDRPRPVPAETSPPAPGVSTVLAASTPSPQPAEGASGSLIADPSRMRRESGVNLAWVAPGLKLSRYRIRVRGYRNATGYSSPQMMQYLTDGLQEELNGISNPTDSTLSAEGLIYWVEARRGERRGMGVEMVFRDAAGNVAAELRHRIIENSPEDAAEEMVEAITDFVEDHKVR